jgi:hypothetical protein
MVSLAQLFSRRRVVARGDDSDRTTTARLVRDLHEARARPEGQHVACDFLQRSRRTLLLVETSEPQRARMPLGALVEALETIFAGSAADGRWLNDANEPCGEHDAQARWVPYDLAEQSAWVDHVAHIAREALAHVDVYLAGSADTLTDA